MKITYISPRSCRIRAPKRTIKATDTSTTITDSTRTAKLVTLNGGNGGVNISAGNTINLEAPKISGSSLNVNAGTTNPDGKVNLIAAIDSREVSRTVTSRNTFWQSNESIGTLNQTLHMTNVNVPANNVNFQGAGGISVQLPKGAKLPQQIATLAKQPGNEYLVDLAKRSDIDWKQVEVINKTWDYKKAGITQETAIVVAIVVTIFTAGAGASLLGAATGTTVAAGTVTAAVANAALTTLATQSAIALLNNKGDVSGALKELGSKENVKNLAIAMVTAGVLQGMGNELGLVSGGKATLLQNLQTNLINGVASSLITTAINGGSLEDSLKNAVKNAVISAIASQGANAIGDLELDKFSSNLAHAFLGCAVGSATAGSSSGCAAGAGGAVVGHLSAEWYGDRIGIKNLEGDALKQAALDVASFAKLTTAIAGLAGGANAMNIAGITSNNTVQNNALLHFSRDLKSAVMGLLANHRANFVFRESANDFSPEIKAAMGGEPVFIEGKGYGYVLEDLNTNGKLTPTVNDPFSRDKLSSGDVVTHLLVPDNNVAEDRLLLNYANDIARAIQTNGASLPDYPSNWATLRCALNMCEKDFKNSNTTGDSRSRDTGNPIPPRNLVNVPGALTDRENYPGQFTINKIKNEIKAVIPRTPTFVPR